MAIGAAFTAIAGVTNPPLTDSIDGVSYRAHHLTAEVCTGRRAIIKACACVAIIVPAFANRVGGVPDFTQGRAFTKRAGDRAILSAFTLAATISQDPGLAGEIGPPFPFTKRVAGLTRAVDRSIFEA